MHTAITRRQRWILLLAAAGIAATTAGCGSSGDGRPPGFAVKITDNASSDAVIRGCAECGGQGLRIQGTSQAAPDTGASVGWQETRAGSHTYTATVEGVALSCPATPKSMTTPDMPGRLSEVDYTVTKQGTCVQSNIGYAS